MKTNTLKDTQPKACSRLCLGLVILAVIGLSGCVSNDHRGSRTHITGYYSDTVPHSYEYYYYPDQHVYFDIHRRVYYYHHHDRGWLTVSRLPQHIHLTNRHHEVLKYKHNRPWNERHVRKNHRAHRDAPQHSRDRDINDRRIRQQDREDAIHRPPAHIERRHDGKRSQNKVQHHLPTVQRQDSPSHLNEVNRINRRQQKPVIIERTIKRRAVTAEHSRTQRREQIQKQTKRQHRQQRQENHEQLGSKQRVERGETQNQPLTQEQRRELRRGESRPRRANDRLEDTRHPNG